MKKNIIREYTDFQEMYNEALDIVHFYSQTEIQGSLTEKIKYIRKTHDREQLNSFYNIGFISELVAKSINSTSLLLKISMDSLVKNIIEHPEISEREYLKIQYYVENADYILLKNEKNLIYFKIDNTLYQFVVKNTKDGKENFITTYHKANIKQLQKDIKRYINIKK